MINNLDILINQKVSLMWNPFLNKLMLFITNIASIEGLVFLSIVLSLFLIYNKRWKNIILLGLSFAFGYLLKTVIRLFVHRERPIDALVPVLGYSFPSGHAVMSTIFFLVLLFSIKNKIKNKILRNIFIIFNILIILLIGFSRIYLHAHWFSDIITGIILGIACVFAVFRLKFLKKKGF